jgi:hypothetical protein
MQSTINNSNNFDASASMSNSNYEKNEYYTEFGLAKGQKKDAKARNHLAVKQAGERQKKVAEQVSLLPKKMQAKLQQEVVTAVSTTGKTKTAPATKIFHIRQKKTQDQLLDDYTEQCVAEDDAFDQMGEVRQDEMYEAYYEEMAREEAENEELRYHTYLVNKSKRDFPDDSMSQLDIIRLSDEILKYEVEMSAKWEADEHYNDYERAREEEEDDAYKAGLAMWISHGLTKVQYDANREYESNVKSLNAFYRELDYQSHPDYENRLKAAIKKYEDDFDAQQKEQDLKDEQNEWWIDPEMMHQVEEDYEPEVESFEDWQERMREENMESARQNAIDERDDDDY